MKDEAAARVLLDPRSRRALKPFVGREASLAEAARESGLPMSTLAYRVKLYLKLGLLEHTRTEPRGGRAVKYYRAPASFFVPFNATPLATTSALSQAAFLEMQRLLDASIGAAWDEAAGAGREIGLHVLDPRGDRLTWNVEPHPDADDPGRFFNGLLAPDGPPVWNTVKVLRLSREAAKRLQHEIAYLTAAYTPEEGEGAREYIVRLAMAPLVREEP